MNKSNTVAALFGIIALLVLIAFIMFFREKFSTAYWLMIFVFLLGLLATIWFAFMRCSGAALGAGIFTLISLYLVWVFHRVNCQNSSCNGNKGGSGTSSGGGHGGGESSSSGSGSSGGGHSPHRVSHRSPH